jgi:hypothetical protein
LLCPKCGNETEEETCISCGIIFAKSKDSRMRLTPEFHLPQKLFAWDVLTIKILWIGNLVYFDVRSIGVSGEGAFFYAVFNLAMAFPASLLIVFGWGDSDVVFSIATLVLGYLQWFVILPRLAQAGWQLVDEVAEKSPEAGKWLESAVGWIRIALRWCGAGYFLVLASNYIASVSITVLFLSGTVAVFLAFRPRRRCRTILDGVAPI